jgi:hypothetical protein
LKTTIKKRFVEDYDREEAVEEDDDQEEISKRTTIRRRDTRRRSYGTQKAIPATASKKAKRKKIAERTPSTSLKNFTSQRMAQRHEVMPWGEGQYFAKGRNPKVETNCSGSSVGVAKSI